MSIVGHCLCGGVSFAIEGQLPKLYRCHCSLCRRQTGADANAALLIKGANFRWLTGQDLISSYVKDTGFRSDFCSRCGSPVPNDLGRVLPGYLWVPAGLLDEPSHLEMGGHLFLGSRASWDKATALDGKLHEALPDDFAAFLALLEA